MDIKNETSTPQDGGPVLDTGDSKDNIVSIKNEMSTPPRSEPVMDTADWRAQLPPDSRIKIVGRIMETLKKHLPFSGQEGLQGLNSIALKFEEKIYSAATCQQDYLRRISVKMLTVENKSQNNIPTSLQSNSPNSSHQLSDSEQKLPMQFPSNQQANHQSSSQSFQNSNASSGVRDNAGQSTNMENISSVSQHSNVTSVGQGMPSNMFSNSQQPMTGRQHITTQQQQQRQNSQQLLYQQQLLLKQNSQQSHIQQRQNLLQPGQLQSSQKSGMQTLSTTQPSLNQSAPLSSGHQNQQSSSQQSQMLQQPIFRTHLQSQQASGVHQQQTSMSQQQQLRQQSSTSNLQQNQMIGSQNSVGDLQQQQPRLLVQQNNLQNMQQQQLLAQQNMSGANQQRFGPQSNISVLSQQQKLSGTQSGTTSLQTNHQSSLYMLQPSTISMHQQQQQNTSNLLPRQERELQSQPVKWQQKLGLQQQSNTFQRNLQQRLQPQTVSDQQKHGYQSQRAQQETSSTSLDSTAETGNAARYDWQEEVYQRIKTMREMYLTELIEMHRKCAAMLKQSESLPQPPKQEQLEKIKAFKAKLDHVITVLQVSKQAITPTFKDKIDFYEKFIPGMISSSHRPRMPASSQQLGGSEQLLPSQLHSTQQSQSQDSQLTHQVHLQQNSIKNVQKAPIGSLQQPNVNVIPNQRGLNVLQQNINPVQSNSSILQHQHLRQQHEQKMFQTQQHKQQQLQMHQQARQQMPAQLQTHQMTQLHQMTDVNKMKMPHEIDLKPGILQQRLLASQAYSHQQLKSGASFRISSPQISQGASPQMREHSSPQLHQKNSVSSLTKSADSPFVVPSPSTSLVQSPMLADSKKSISGTSTIPGNILHEIWTPGISASPLLAEFTSSNGAHGNVLVNVPGKSIVAERPIERLIKALTKVDSMSSKSLAASASDIGSVVSMLDSIAGSAPGNGSRAAVGEDLDSMIRSRVQARNLTTLDGMSRTRKMRSFTGDMSLNVESSAGSVNDSFKPFSVSDTDDMESTASSGIKRPKVEVSDPLLEEIREINQRLIDTVVDISDEAAASAVEGGEGTVVRCSFSSISLCPDFKSHYACAQRSPIQPLRLLIPSNYPNCSPILVDEFPIEISNEYEDLSMKVKSRFSRSLRRLPEPMSLGVIAKTWDACNHEIISEHAQQSGGGTFSSQYGTWETCLTA